MALWKYTSGHLGASLTRRKANAHLRLLGVAVVWWDASAITSRTLRLRGDHAAEMGGHGRARDGWHGLDLAKLSCGRC